MSDMKTNCINEIESLRAQLAAAIAERDAAFAMSRCECESDEACANLVNLREQLAARDAKIAEQALSSTPPSAVLAKIKADTLRQLATDFESMDCTLITTETIKQMVYEIEE